MARVFLSYRREDAPDAAGRIYDRLAAELGADQVFWDVDAIRIGRDFVRELQTAVSECDVLVAVIGPGWLTATDRDGRRRLDRPEDWVRTEVLAALERDVTVVPVLVGGIEMPSSADLPEELHGLASRQALEVSHRRFNHDVGELVEAIKHELAAVEKGDPARDVAGLAEPRPVAARASESGEPEAPQVGAAAGPSEPRREHLRGPGAANPSPTAGAAAGRPTAAGPGERALAATQRLRGVIGLRDRPISRVVHGALEYIAGIAFIAIPVLLDFYSDVAVAIAVIVGIVVLTVAASSEGPTSLVDQIPIAAHVVFDYALAIFLVVAPFLFGFSDETGPLIFFVLLGTGHLILTIDTRFVSEGPQAGPERRQGAPAAEAPRAAAVSGGAEPAPGDPAPRTEPEPRGEDG